MDIWENNYTSPLGYRSGGGRVDSYGVDHSGFSVRDELEYQRARMERENQLMQNYNQMGITAENYPQYGAGFWGGTPKNNYGFGSSNISGNIENVTNALDTNGIDGGLGAGGGFNNPTQTGTADYTVNMQSLVGQPSSYFQDNSSLNGYNSAEAQRRAQILQEQRNAVNQILMNGMDVLYGMNRTLNGMTFGGLDYLGNKFGFDSQMNNYLQLKNPQERELAQNVGQLVQLGGGALTGGALAKAGLNQANIAYNGYKIGKKYDQLTDNPFQGNGTDIVARMKNHNGEPVVLQRGEAIRGPNGEVIVHGKPLGKETGTVQNFGLDKGIYRHNINRADAQRIPRIIQQKPVETNNYGQNVYVVRGINGELRIVTSPIKGKYTISSMYYPRK